MRLGEIKVVANCNLLSKDSRPSILRRGVEAVLGPTTLGPSLGGGHSASIEPARSKLSLIIMLQRLGSMSMPPT